MTTAEYEFRVEELMAEGMTRSDAQAVVDVEDMQEWNMALRHLGD